MLILLFLLPFVQKHYGQCPPPTASVVFQANSLSSTVQMGDRAFSTFGDFLGLEIPDLGAGLIYNAEFWFAGQSPDLQLKLAGGFGDFYPGPLNETTADVEPGTCMDYDQFWVLTLQQSLTHIAYHDALASGTAEIEFPDGYAMPDVFQTYPAHGSDNQSLYLAPFYDYDQDGTYNPEFGDCPLFDSMIDEDAFCQSCNALGGDVSLFWIENDMGNVHVNTGGAPIGIEVHNNIYAFIDQDEILDQTFFFKKKVINRGSQTLQNTYAGFHFDSDLGNPNDDYVGCDIGRNLAYSINGDGFDEASMSSDGFGEDIPGLGILILNGAENDIGEDSGLSGFMTYNNSSISGATSTPSLPSDYYNYMKSIWKDGTPLTCGGTGYQDGEIQTNHMFSGSSSEECEEWSESLEGIFPGDRRMLLNSEIQTFEPGDEQCFQVALFYVMDENDNDFIIDDLEMGADVIQDYFDNCFEDFTTDINDDDRDYEVEYTWNQPQSVLTVFENLEIQIINSIGQTVHSQRVISGDDIHMDHFSKGVYLLRFENDSGQTHIEKIFVE